MKTYDTIVIGLGAMGSATTYQLAMKGVRVLGVDQFNPPHDQGSSHGDTRITRLAIGEGDEYVPLVKRSHEIWKSIQNEYGQKLLHLNGGLIISSKAKSAINHVENFFENTLEAAAKFDIKHDTLGADEVRARFPQFNIKNDEVGYFEEESGYLLPEKCVEAQLSLAKKYGANINIEEKVLNYQEKDEMIIVKTNKNEFKSKNLVLCAGPWMPELLKAKISKNLKVYRQVLYWFDVSDSKISFEPDKCPIFIWELQGAKQGIYGFPAVDGKYGGIKIATEQFISTTAPGLINREVSELEIQVMYEEYVKPYINGVSSKCLKAVSCLYTATEDFGFVIDKHPDYENVMIVSPCSGHGFKHSAAIGESVAEWVINGKSKIDLSSFSLSRFK